MHFIINFLKYISLYRTTTTTPTNTTSIIIINIIITDHFNKAKPHLYIIIALIKIRCQHLYEMEIITQTYLFYYLTYHPFCGSDFNTRNTSCNILMFIILLHIAYV